MSLILRQSRLVPLLPGRLQLPKKWASKLFMMEQTVGLPKSVNCLRDIILMR